MQILHMHVTHSRVLANIHKIPVYVATTKQTNAAAVVLTCNSNAMSNIDTKTGDSFQTGETLLVRYWKSTTFFHLRVTFLGKSSAANLQQKRTYSLSSDNY